MGKAVSNIKAVSKKGVTRWWTREEIAQAMKDYIKSRKGIDIYHVISYEGDQWGVLREGCKRLHKIYDDKGSAVAHAKRLAQRSSMWKVVVHKEDATPERYIHSDK
jgi:hypothetical protein